MSVKSSRRKPVSKSDKPRKPRDFPLSIHKGTGYWCRKVHGHVHYFGKVADDPKGVAALERWLADKDDLYAHRTPRPKSGELVLGDLCNEFLTHKGALRDHDELDARTFQTYHATCEAVVDAFGRNRAVVDLTPNDFRLLRDKLARSLGKVSLRNTMQRVRGLFKFAFDQGLILSPVRFGQSFAKPKLDSIRRDREAHRDAHGDRMFEPEEIRAILSECNQPLRAMVWLAANCGFGQTDLSRLPTRAVNLDTRWLEFARPKTGVRRRIPLWPETVESIREWLTIRPTAKDSADAGLLFLTCRGQRWVKLTKPKEDKPGGTPIDAIGQEFRKVLDRLGIKRPRLSFYGLRHSVETLAGDTGDQVAIDAIMGHVPQGMGAHYRERINDDRLRRVTEHVRKLIVYGPWTLEGGAR